MSENKKNEILVAGKLGDQILILNKEDVPFIGGSKALDVYCVLVDLVRREIDPPEKLELHLKFNPWEETDDQEKQVLSQLLYSRISDKDIFEKIVLPLAEKLVKQEI